MAPAVTLTIYCVLVLLASVAGGLIPLWIRLTHRRLQFINSVVAGFMLGVGLLHMLPHSVLQTGSVEQSTLWLLLGFLVIFLLERFFCFHHHDVPADVGDDAAAAEDDNHEHEQGQTCGHDHGHPPAAQGVSRHHVTWSGAAIGLTLHSLLDGAALAAAVELESAPGLAPGMAPGIAHGMALVPGAWAGLAVFMVIFFHRPFDAMALGALMSGGGFPIRSRHLINALFALVVPVGAVLFLLGVAGLSHTDHSPVGLALAFSAGMFVCIASSDLLPELQFHQHDRFKLTMALIFGLALAWGISFLESRTEAHHHHAHLEQPHELHDE